MMNNKWNQARVCCSLSGCSYLFFPRTNFKKWITSTSTSQPGLFSLVWFLVWFYTSYFKQTGDNTLHHSSKNSLFLDLVLPILIMSAAREVDLKLMFRNLNYIILYGFVGTFLNFVGLFCFVIVFAETFNLKLLDHSNRGLKSASVVGNSDCHWYHISPEFDKKEKVPKSAFYNFRRRNFEWFGGHNFLPHF